MVTHCNILMYKHNRMTSFKLKVYCCEVNTFSQWLNYSTDIEAEVDVNRLLNGLKCPNLKIMLHHHCLIWLKLLFIFLVKLIFIAVLINLIHLWHLPFSHRLPGGDALQAWRTISSAQRTECHLLKRYPCKGILQTKRTSVPNGAMVPSERTHPQTQKPTGHLDVVLKQTWMI